MLKTAFLDTAPLTTNHFFLFLASFLYAYIALAIVQRIPIITLRRNKTKPSIYYGGVVIISLINIFCFTVINQPYLIIGLLITSIIIVFIGTLDEIKNLSPSAQLISQFAIAAIISASGWVIRYISNPWSEGIIYLQLISVGNLSLMSIMLTSVWLVFLMNAINWIDGADGLAGGIGSVAFITLAVVALLPSVQDSRTLSLAIIGAGVTLGFLIWNWPPAKVYLGTTGSWFLGLFIGITAIVGGGKIATTLLVLAIPTLDVILVIIQRLVNKQAPWQGDTKHHLHQRLQAAGLSPQTITLLAILFSASFGLAAISLQTHQKIWTLAVVGALQAVAAIILWLRHKQRKSIPNTSINNL